MSLHSNSSSELEDIPYCEIIPVFVKDFRKDFDFNDVKDKVREILCDVEFEYIEKEKGYAQIAHLIWVLQNKSDKEIIQFLDLISVDYYWIVNKIKTEKNNERPKTKNYLQSLKKIQNCHQHHTDYNVHRTKQFLKLSSALQNIRSHSSVILLGDLGSGKKWLCIDVCSDYLVLKRMNYNIFWIDCSKCISPQEDYNALKIFMNNLNHLHQFNNCHISNSEIQNNIYQLQQQIKQLLNSKQFDNCLLVLINVRNTKCLNAFDLGCKRLITTRNKKVYQSLSTKLNKHLILDEGFTLNEFHLLLDKYITTYSWRKEIGVSANDIYHMSNGDPYMLSIIARNLNEKKSNWHEWRRHLNNFQIPDKKFQRDIENSLTVLSSQQLELYATFAVFPYCAQIPVKLLAYLWQKQLDETEKIVKGFHEHSFIQKHILDDNDTIVCSLTYLYSCYIKNCSRMQELINAKELHGRIVEYYQVEEHLNDRKDVNLDFGQQHDGYFFRWIGYHLYGAGYEHLFSKLYKDFGFLGQKLRAVGLNSMIADLHYYNHEIAQGDREYSFKKLKTFLAKIEEKILYYPDCCLLQYALFSDDFIKEYALKQVQKFRHRAFFTESGKNHQRRFTMSLPQTPKLLRILDHELCLVVLNNDDIYLLDLSLDANIKHLHLIKGSAVNSVNDIQIFDNKNLILIMNKYGNLKLWDISEEKRLILNQRRGSDAYLSNKNYICPPTKFSPKSYKQIINEALPRLSKIVAFNLVQINSDDVLYVALNNGFVKFFHLNRETKQLEEQSQIIPLKTDVYNIHSICNIRNHFMMIDYNDNSNMNVTFLNRRNTKKEAYKYDWPQNTKLVYHKVCDNIVIFVFNHVVLRLTLTFSPFNGKVDTIYESPQCIINCGKLLLENKYLMLGTERGLLICDMTTGVVELQSSVSENIICVDNYDLDDDEYKSMIVCGSSSKDIMYIFGLRLLNNQTLVWEHYYLHCTEELSHLEQHKNTRFLGQTLFDMSDEDETLYAVDSKYRIHQICCAETNNYSIITPLETQKKIIAINCFKNTVLVALENGDVYDMQEKRLVVQATNSDSQQFFLKTVDNNILVTSSAREVTYVTHMTNDNQTDIQVLTKYCTMVMNKYLVIVNNFGAVLFFDCDNNFSLEYPIQPFTLLADCDLKENTLFLGFSSYAVHIHSIAKTNLGIECPKRREIKQNHESLRITCLTASTNAKLFAIGLDIQPATALNGLRTRGDIEVFQLDDNYKEQLLYCLKSHARPINDMMFSPLNDVLVSVSEQICFWNVNHILNNPLDVSNKKRHSSRFNSQKSSEEVDFRCALKMERCSKHDSLQFVPQLQQKLTSFENHKLDNSMSSFDAIENCVLANNLDKIENVWSMLVGPSDKPELFSCLKLDGNEAKRIFANKDFTQFHTIDDEGVYYNLKLLKPSLPITPELVDTPDSTSCSTYIDYTDIHPLSVACSTMSGADVVDDANT